MHKVKMGKEREAYLNSLPVTRKEFLELKSMVEKLIKDKPEGHCDKCGALLSAGLFCPNCDL